MYVYVRLLPFHETTLGNVSQTAKQYNVNITELFGAGPFVAKRGSPTHNVELQLYYNKG